MKAIEKSKFILFVLLLPGLVIYSVYAVFPILISFFYSLFRWNGVNELKFILFNNYIELVKDPTYLICIRNVGIYVAAIMFIQIPLSLLIAIFISYKIRGSRFYKIVIFFPVVISQVIIALIFNLLLNSQFGLVNSIFRALNLNFLDLDWLGDGRLAIWSVSLTNAWQYVGIVMVILLAGIAGISDEIYQACEVDGASRFQSTIFVTIPMIWEQLKVCFILQFVGTLNDFALIFNMTMGGPLHASEVPTTYMYKQAFQHMKYGYGMAISTSIFIICIVFIWTFNYVTSRKKNDIGTV